MKTTNVLFTLFFMAIGSSVFADAHVENPGYKTELFARFSPATGSLRSMVFDAEGNLYLASATAGSITKITPDKQVNTSWVTGLNNPGGIEYTGGTSYGNNLYVTCTGSNKVVKVDMNGNQTDFCSLSGASAVQYDRTGQYGNKLYVGTSTADRIYSLSTAGSSQIFCNSFYNYSGSIYNLGFANSTAYGNAMYAATYYPNNRDKSGIIRVLPNGTTERICTNLAYGYAIDYDDTGLFGGYLFASAYPVTPSSPWDSDIYSISSNGVATPFISGGGDALHGFTFGPDGAMYVLDYTGVTSDIYRITPIPEPITMLLFGLGFLGLPRRKR